jgi:methionyl-tRNA formyltransferase
MAMRGGIELACVVSQPDRASGRGGRLKPTAVSRWASERKIRLLRPNKPDEDLAEHLRELGCDLIFVMAYGHILRSHILALPPLGIYNFHGSLLPKYRGASPVETAIACGERVTGVSLIRVALKMDAGALLDVEPVGIGETDFASQVYGKLSRACVTVFERNIENLMRGTAKCTEQNHGEATFTRKITKLDGCIDFSLAADEIHSRVRGFFEHVGSHVHHGGTILNVGEISIENSGGRHENFGEIVGMGGNHITVAARIGMVRIGELQRPGGRMLKVRDFLNGYGLAIGDRFDWLHAPPILSTNRQMGR